MKDYHSVHRDLLGMLQDLDGKLEQIVDEQAGQPAVTETAASDSDLSDAARVEVEKIKQTIAGIQNGRSGICLLCGQSIDQVRLARLPFAHYCSRCVSHSD